MKVMIVCPAYDGKMHVETVMSLIAEVIGMAAEGIITNVVAHPGNSIITRARNLLLMEFLDSDYTDIVFIDNDISWEAGKMLAMLKHDVDIVGGAYPVRCDPERYMIRYLEKEELWADEKTGLLEVEGIPGGFMRISRKALETMIEKNPELAYEELSAKNKIAYRLFDFAQEGAYYWGEDMWFCRLARKCGLKVWLAPEIIFSHIGYKAFTGSVGAWLRNRKND